MGNILKELSFYFSTLNRLRQVPRKKLENETLADICESGSAAGVDRGEVAIADLITRTHFLALPSHHEGMPNVVLEDIAAGNHVIGSDIQRILELMKPAETGHLFQEGHTDGLSNTIIKLIENPRGL